MSTITANNVTKVDGTVVLGWTLLSTTVASGDAVIDVINLSSTYYMYKFIWYGTQSSIDNTSFRIRTSSDNGSSWDVGGSDYRWGTHRVSMATSPVHGVSGDGADTEITVSGAGTAIGNAANEVSDWEITCFNPSDTEYTKFKWEATPINRTSTGYIMIGSGARISAAAVNGVRFLYGTGNISGTLKVYGVRA